ncbi:MAG: carboxyl-terminal processing protease [Chloroflexota bacterium]|jgi:carboxyl-terminal processing protease|nr:carboxyl-terminal processing protease [Chloroflexota bacterium]
MIRFRPVLLLVAALVVSSCAAVQELPIPRATTNFATAEAAFNILIERHVDKPSSQQLLNAALDAVQTLLVKMGDPSQTVTKPTFTGSPQSDFAKFAATLNDVVAANPKEDPKLVEQQATDGMARSMNECHTYYLDPNRAKGFNAPPSEYSGIGATITSPGPNELVEIAQVFPGSPAEKAGVKKGDKIKTVNGEDMSGSTSDVVANKIKGPEGTTVNIVFVRNGADTPIAIVRGKVTPPRVIDQIDDGNVGYIQVTQLNGDVSAQVLQAVNRQNAAGVIGRVLDLRDDPGGDLSAAVDIASIFMRNATIVYQVGRDGNRTPLRTNDRMYVNDPTPLVVLVNKNSASGAEIIAAGVRANGVGTVMGEQTAGCVGIGQPRELPDGGLLLVTIARMEDAKTGEGLNGPGKGVVPDKIVVPDQSGTDNQRLAADALVRNGGRS